MAMTCSTKINFIKYDWLQSISKKNKDYKVDFDLEDVLPRHNEKPGSNKNKQKTNIPFSDAYKCDL